MKQGKRELTLTEAKKLSNILGVSLKEMESGISANYEKYKQMILAYIRNAGSKIEMLMWSFAKQNLKFQEHKNQDMVQEIGETLPLSTFSVDSGEIPLIKTADG